MREAAESSDGYLRRASLQDPNERTWNDRGQRFPFGLMNLRSSDGLTSNTLTDQHHFWAPGNLHAGLVLSHIASEIVSGESTTAREHIKLYCVGSAPVGKFPDFTNVLSYL